jgi:chromosome segregation ATPase
MTVTLQDFESLQAQLLQEKTENYNLQEQLEAAKRRSSLTPAQMADRLRSDCSQLRVRLQQQQKENETLTYQLHLVKISQFLHLTTIWESPTNPDLNPIPPELRESASEVMHLIKDVKEQLNRKSFLETQINELQKKSKTLGRAEDALHSSIDEMRVRQKSELSAVDSAREQLQRLEREAAALREQLQAVTSAGASSANPEDLKTTHRRIARMENQIQQRRERNKTVIASLEAKITENNRHLDDARSAETVLNKKMIQKRLALQTEINRRRGIIVHSSRISARGDSAQLFLESKNLIGKFAQKQQEVWELEERIAFSRNTRMLLAKDILKRMFAKADPQKGQQMVEVAMKVVLEMAEIERKKNGFRTR